MYSSHSLLVKSRSPRYAKAIDDLLSQMNLPEEINTQLEFEELSNRSPFFAEERSERWRAFFNQCAPSDRLVASTKRRLWMYFALARLKKTCAYCWVPVTCCICKNILENTKAVPILMASLQSGGLLTPSGDHCDALPPRPQCKVTIILHAQEVLRMTNSAHIAAMAMNAGMLIWGLPEHDERISALGRYWVANPPAKGSGLGWPVDHTSTPTREKEEGLAGGAPTGCLSEEGTPTTAESERHGLSSDDLNASTGALVAEGSKGKTPKPRKERTEPIYPRTTTNSVMRRRKTTDTVGDSGAPAALDEDELADERDMSVLLYPAVDASIPFAQLLSYRESVVSRASAQHTEETHRVDENTVRAGASRRPSGTASSIPQASAIPALHIYLSDGTWSQARVVNRQVPLHMPRVALEISSRYDGLFQGLRKRTRESGVSTLEATTIAVSQAIARDTSCGLFSASDAATASDDEVHLKVSPSALKIEESLFRVMRMFVETVSLISSKCSPQSSECGNGGLAGERNSVMGLEQMKAISAGERAHKQAMQKIRESHHNQRHTDSEAILKLMPAPVTNFCYVCDVFVGFELMKRHVLKPMHTQKSATKQPLPFDPSPASKNIWKFKNHPSVPCKVNLVE